MVVRLTVSYRGTAYAGWQRQDNALSVQEVLERALARVLTAEVSPDERPVVVSAASRTDAGVHARGQVVHLAVPEALPGSVSLRGLVLGTNTHLPEDVRVMAAARVPPEFHARRCALGKEYLYRLSRAEVVSPLEGWAVARMARLGRPAGGADAAPDLEALRRATGHLVGWHDFSAFALAGGAHTQPFRTVREAGWEERGDELVFRVVGDGFLRGMVRGLVGTLVEVAWGRRRVEGFVELLGGAARGEAGVTAPARGLVLERVFYGEEWRAVKAWPGEAWMDRERE